MLTKKDHTRLIKRAYSLFKSGAKRRKLTCNLTIEQYEDVILGKCTYCGSDHSSVLKYRGLTLQKNGVDRINNSVGYEMYNVLSACTFCNTLRASMGWESWASLVNDITVHRSNRSPLLGGRPTEERASQSYYRGR